MIVHYLLFFVTVVFSKVVEKTGKPVMLPDTEEEENRAAFIAAILAYLPTIILMGLRDSMGDTDGYIDTFNANRAESVFESLSDRNPGYSAVMNFFKLYISENANYFLLFITFLSVLLMLKTYCKYSPMLALSSYVFFGSTEVSYLYNGARQFLALAIMFYAFKYIEQKKLIKYAICALLAFSIHQTVIIVIPAYFLASGKFLNYKIILMGFATIAATAFSSLFIDYLNELFISESVYSQYYDMLIDTEGINIFRVLVAAIPFVLCMIYKKRIDELDDNILNCSANLSVLALAVSVFAAASGGQLLGRLAEYYLIYNTLTYPLLFKRVVSKNARLALQVCLMIGYFFFFFYQFTVMWGQGYQSNTLGIRVGVGD